MPTPRKSDGTADYSKVGRANKNRGRNFERQVAEKLGWTRVPYSGAVKEWGGADVVDGFYQRKGYWAAECKTQQPGVGGSLSIKHKWVSQMLGGEANERKGIIITKAAGSQHAFVVMTEDTWESTLKKYRETWIHEGHTFRRGIGCNFVIDGHHLDFIRKDGNCVAEIVVRDNQTKNIDDATVWYVLTLTRFAEIVKKFNLYTPEAKPDA